MQFFLEMLLTGWIDPYLWFKSMSTLGNRKSKKKSILIFLIYCSLIDAKGIMERYWESNIMRECLMILVFLYSVWATGFLFEGSIYKKALHIVMFQWILIITELSVIGAYAFLAPKNLEEVLGNGLSNLICGGIIKTVQALLCDCFFGSKRRDGIFYTNRERVILILMCYIMLSNLYLKRIVYKENLDVIILLETLFLFWYIISSFFSLKGKNKDIGSMKQKVESSLCTKRQISDIDQFRHDFSANMFLMKNLWYYKDYKKLEHFMDTVFSDVEKVKLAFEHPNFPIRIVVSNFIQMAANAGVLFDIHMEVKEFGMTDEEICTVLHNLILNSLELAPPISVSKAYIRLEVLYNDIGYSICCQSMCMKEGKRKQDNKKGIDRADLSMEIVNRIINKYDGIVQWKEGESKMKSIYEREVYIRIPYK